MLIKKTYIIGLLLLSIFQNATTAQGIENHTVVLVADPHTRKMNISNRVQIPIPRA